MDGVVIVDHQQISRARLDNDGVLPDDLAQVAEDLRLDLGEVTVMAVNRPALL